MKPNHKKRNVRIGVFLKGKIVSCDAIVPILLEAKSINPNLNVEFHIPDARTYSMLKKNVLLWDSMGKLGRVFLTPERATLHGKFASVAHLLRFVALGLLQQLTVIHFSASGSRKLRLLSFVSPRRCYRFHQHVFGFPKSLWDMNRLYLSKRGIAVSSEPTYAETYGKQVFFDENLPKHFGVKELDSTIILDPPRKRRAWLKYVADNSDQYFNAEFPDLKEHKRSGIITIISGGFMPDPVLRKDDTLLRLFENTIVSLVEISKETPIMVKPRFDQDIPIIEAVIEKHPSAIIRMTHLHPSLLALWSKIFVTNIASTTFGDALAVGVPTIEFSDYGDELLDLTSGGSMWPELTTVFVNRDLKAFSRAVSELVRQPPEETNLAGPIDDPTGLYHDLAFGRPWLR